MKPNLLFKTRLPKISPPVQMGLSDNKFIPEAAVPETLNPSGALCVTKFTEPPMASASMLGKTALYTSMV